MLHNDANNLLSLSDNLGIFIKNIDGKYLSCNEVLAKKLKLKGSKDIVGMTDYDLPILYKEAQALRAGDLKVIKTKKSMKFNYFVTINDYYFSFYTFKAPFFDASGHIVGIYGIDNYLHTENSKPLKKMIYAKQNETIKLTMRQQDCLFYLVRGMTIKEIARILNLAPRTVEHHLEALKIKFDCNTRSALVTHALKLPIIRKNLNNSLSMTS